MTAIHDVFLVCDVCQQPSSAVAEGQPTTREAREDAKSLGWHFTNGRDICDSCWSRGRR